MAYHCLKCEVGEGHQAHQASNAGLACCALSAQPPLDYQDASVRLKPECSYICTHTHAHTSKRRGMPRQPHVGHAGVLGHDRSPDLGSARGAEAGATSPDARPGFAAPAWGGSATPDNGAAQAAAAAAARAAAFLNSSRENLQELLQPPTSPGRPLGRYACVCVCICMGACMRVRVRAYV